MNVIFKIQSNSRIIHTFKRNLQSSKVLNRRPPHHRTIYKLKQFPFNNVYYDNDASGPLKVVIDELKNYPPGQWGSTSIKDAWKRYKEMKSLQRLPTNIDKLISLSWNEYNMYYHTLDMPMNDPETLEFAQFITRTKIDNLIPDVVKDSFSSISSDHIDMASKMLIAQTNNYFAQKQKFIYDYDTLTQEKKSTEFVIQLMDSIFRSIRNFDFENNTTSPESLIETFIKRYGYDQLKVDENVKDAEGCVHYQMRGKLAWNLRSRDPLKEFLKRDDPIFINDGKQFPIYNYHPKLFGLEPTDCNDFRNLPFYHARDSSKFARFVPGFWGSSHVKPGDPCAFSVLGVINTNRSYRLISEFLPDHPNIINRHFVSEAILAGFTWTMAQAMNQGFTLYDELTYPICTCLLLTDGNSVQMMYYQLNSIGSLWKPEDAGHPVNMMWISPKMSLYQMNDNNQVVSVNEDALHQILAAYYMPKSILPTEELQPYIQEKAPKDIESFILDFDPKKATEKELVEYKKRNKIRQMKVLPRPHPNHNFYFDMVDRFQLNQEFRNTVPGVDSLPRKIVDRMVKKNLWKLQRKGKKKLLPLPSTWR